MKVIKRCPKTQQRETERPRGKTGRKTMRKGEEVVDSKKSSLGIKWKKKKKNVINSTKLKSDLVKISRENVRRCRRKFTLHMLQLHLLLLKLKSYLMMTEHPS